MKRYSLFSSLGLVFCATLFSGELAPQKLDDWTGYALEHFLKEKDGVISTKRGPFFYFPEKFSPPQTGEFFESQKEEHFHFSKNSPGETGTSFCLKKEFEHRENGRKEIRTSGLYT